MSAVKDIADSAHTYTVTTNGACYVEFNFKDPHGLSLAPGEAVVLKVPETHSSQILRNMMLAHRKGTRGSRMGDWDMDPAYTAVIAHHNNTRWRDMENWQPYIDDFGNGGALEGNRQPGKYAEYRPAHDPEIEGLHDWHMMPCGPSAYDAIRICSVGKGVLNVHWLYLFLYPQDDKLYRPVTTCQEIFTPKTSFGDYAPLWLKENPLKFDEEGKPLQRPALEAPYCGGGEFAVREGKLSIDTLKYKGLYPDALALPRTTDRDAMKMFAGLNSNGLVEEKHASRRGRSSRRVQAFNVQKNIDHWKLDHNILRIPIPDGTYAAYIEVAMGDTSYQKNRQPESQKDRLGFYGVRRGARLSMSTKNGDKILEHQNVPPAGFVAVTCYDLQPENEEIIMWSDRSVTYLMGYRIVLFAKSTNSSKHLSSKALSHSACSSRSESASGSLRCSCTKKSGESSSFHSSLNSSRIRSRSSAA